MSTALRINITRDTATPAVEALRARCNPTLLARAVGDTCSQLTKGWLGALPPNKRGWPSSGFWQKAAKGTDWTSEGDTATITVDVDGKPGAVRQRYRGGPIDAKDKLLAIPARQEFYGRSPTEFTNLRFVMFGSGAMAFVVGKGGLGQVDFATGRERNVKGAGARSQAVVAYWLKDHVDQDGDPGVLPPPEAYREAAHEIMAHVIKGEA